MYGDIVEAGILIQIQEDLLHGAGINGISN
jgi:hypothetical protein